MNVFEGNEGAIKLAINKHASGRTKLIDVKYHLVRDASDARKVRVAYVRSENQHADLLTKPLSTRRGMNRIDKYSVKSEDKEINDTRNHRHSKKKQQGEKTHFDSILTDRTKYNKTNNSHLM